MRTLGIILAAGKSTRLYPATIVATKQLLPIYDKPLIYYPLSTLMLAGIRDFIVITAPDEIENFRRLLGDSEKEFGVKIELLIQEKPVGIADAFNIVGKHLREKIFEYDNHALILGDNIFYGAGLSGVLGEVKPNLANVFLYHVQNPEAFGVAEIAPNNTVLSIEEKPVNPKSNLAVTGLYFYPPSVYLYTAQLSPSSRGELEISDLNSYYLKLGQLTAVIMQRGMVWFDTGNADSMLEASNFIQTIQKHQDYLIGSPHEIAIAHKWVKKEDITPFIEKCGKTKYGKYLKQLLGETI